MEVNQPSPLDNQGRNKNRIKIQITFGDYPLDAQTSVDTIYCDTIMINALAVAADGSASIVYATARDGDGNEPNHLLLYRMWAFFLSRFILSLGYLDEFFKKQIETFVDKAVLEDIRFQNPNKDEWKPSDRTKFSDN